MLKEKNSINIVFLDLDGTLLKENGKIGFLNKWKIKKLQKNFYICFNTGKSFLKSLKIKEKIKNNNESVSFGGHVVSWKEKNNYKHKISPINKRIIVKIINFIKNNKKINNIWLEDFDEGAFFLKNSESNLFKMLNSNQAKKINFENIKNFKKIVSFFVELQKETNVIELEKEIRFLCEKKVDFSVWKTEKNLPIFSFRKAGINKWVGAKKIIEMKKNKFNKIISIGNGNSDIPLLKNSDIGVALKNSVPELKKVAKIVSKRTNQKSGVIYELKKMKKN